ncbi:MAG: isoleucine--tRNA ligase [Candidatus Omnitrophota bacterium]
MKANLAGREPQMLAKWEQENLYAAIRKNNSGKPKFVLHDGPPYANGNIHIGHALNKILKDMIVKYWTMKGFDSHYVPGWDCHGLPIEHQLFKELKTDKSKVDCVEFRKKAHDYAMKYVGLQREQFKRLGVFGDWENPYLTLSKDYEYWILKSLAALNDKKYIYRGLKPVNWCPTCETALAEAEVEYENHESPAVYVKFKVNNPESISGFPKGKDLFLLIWTTTPWTLLANVAVAVHPKYKYLLIESGQQVFIVESSLANSVLEKGNIRDHKVLKELSGESLKSLTYVHPFGSKKECPVVTVDYVTKEDGTGLVHTAPGHGQEDYQTGLKYHLDIVMPVDGRGIFKEEAGVFAGTHVFKANEKIIEALQEQGKLFFSEKIQHSYPHCWRCKKPVIFRATEQWFLKIDHNNLREQLNKVIKEDVRWIPAAGQERILGMIQTRPDWCLSRQRYWGVPIPALSCKACGKYHLDSSVIERFAEMARKEGTDCWFIKDIKEFISSGLTCPHCKKSDFEKTNDILDVWFDSGVSHQAVAKAMLGEKLPVDLYLEGSDQHRGWFQSSLIPAVAMEGKAPYKAVLTHGFVMDGQGRKMSKSLGNVVAPEDVIKNYGADILRLWVAASNYNEDIRISKEILERLIDAYRKIRNTARYMLSNIYDFDPQKDKVAYKDLLEIDQWALYRLGFTLNVVESAYGSHVENAHYDFAKAYQAIYSFCNDDLSSFYLDILKDRLYTSAAKSQERRAAQTVLYEILDVLVRMAAPMLSFTAQEILEFMPKDPTLKNAANVHLLPWPKALGQWKEDKTDEKFKVLIALRPHVSKALEEKRQQGLIGSSLDAKIVFETASERDLKQLNQFSENELKSVFIVSGVKVKLVSEIKNGIGADFPQTAVVVEKADGQKCERCWNYSVLVGQDKQHLTLCERCTPVVKEMPDVKKDG